MRARSRLLLVAIVVVHLLAPRMRAQTPAPSRVEGAAVDFSAIDRVVAQELTDAHTPGAAVSIVSGDRVVFSKETALEKVGANSFRAGDSRLVTVADAAGKVEYIHTGGRSWRKVS
jgi:hypothetical protein